MGGEQSTQTRERRGWSIERGQGEKNTASLAMGRDRGNDTLNDTLPHTRSHPRLRLIISVYILGAILRRSVQHVFCFIITAGDAQGRGAAREGVAGAVTLA